MSTRRAEAVATVDRPEAKDADFTAYLVMRQPALLRTAYLLTGDPHQAEDVLQTSLAKLYLAWDRIEDPGALDGYVRRIMVNETTSLWRRAWKRREVVRSELPETPAAEEYDDGTAAAVWELVQGLPPRARAVVVLRYYEQLTAVEVADVLGISVGTVKSQASRALRALRDQVPAELREEGREQ
ncbi:SigE family RNA polymerase sigma factor [Nocardioides insulae]|uniref:SigE family RNA polymerase sigma factor n=1 Tax=Nocardioides insulae TaxID=394734 RepID=UPI00042597A3|nr:SigE family RNA polymerase sigma factor [Nocardioides insulae]